MFITGTLVVGGALYAATEALEKLRKQKTLRAFLAHDNVPSPAPLRQSLVDEGREVIQKLKDTAPLADSIRSQQLQPFAKAVGKLHKQRNLRAFLAPTNRTQPSAPLLQSLVAEGREVIQKLKSVVPLADDVRSQQLQTFALDNLSEEEREVNRFFKISTGVLGFAMLTSLVYPPAHVIALPLLLYTLIPVFMDAYEGLKAYRLRPSFLDCLAVVGVVGLGLPHLNPYYFLAGSLGVWIFFFSAKLLLKTKDKSKTSLSNLFGEQPRCVWLLRDGVEVETPFENVRVGDIVVVNAGEIIPVDGSIMAGVASIDQRMLTGEAQPAEKGVGDPIFAATVVLAGRICIAVEKAGADILAAQIGAIWSRTADYKTFIESRGEHISRQAVLPILGTSALALSTLGPVSATAVLLSNFVENIKLAAPISTLNFLHRASHQGILIKDGRALELLKQVDTVVFDKTGTLTQERPTVGNIFLCDDYDENALLTYAAAAEVKQNHPIARAILHAAHERHVQIPALSEAEYEVGYGIKARINDHMVQVGSDRFMDMEGIPIPPVIRAHLAQSHAQGHSLVMVAIDARLCGAITLRPTIRPEAKDVIRRLKQRQLALCIISGDHDQPTRNLAQELGIEQYFAETLPEDKATLIAQLQQAGKSVCFVGDGINDAIALKQANVSISLCGATTAATDTAQMIMMDGSLHHLDYVFELAQQFEANLRTSLVTVLGGSALCIGGIFLLHFGIYSALILGTASMVVSVGNACLPALNGQMLIPARVEVVAGNDSIKEGSAP